MAGKLSTKNHKIKTDKQKHSLVKVIAKNKYGKWLSPPSEKTFYITEDSKFPNITFEIQTTEEPPFEWKWKITWQAKVSGLKESSNRGKAIRTFTKSGSFKSKNKSWKADLSGEVIGGILSVEVITSNVTFKRSVHIKGTQPTESDVKKYLKTIENTDGFAKIIEQETHFKQFINADHLPVVSFDGGYGITQLTNPTPTYEQAWNWKHNITAGSKLYQQKQKAAKTYLGQNDRSYTKEQLRMETWSRWNGGKYHVWDEEKKQWIRNPDVLCDSDTGNIGWNMTKSNNAGKTEEDLHKRDASTYSDPGSRDKTHTWIYCGECYADHLANE